MLKKWNVACILSWKQGNIPTVLKCLSLMDIYDVTNIENWGHHMIFAAFDQSDLMWLESCYFLIESVFR